MRLCSHRCTIASPNEEELSMRNRWGVVLGALAGVAVLGLIIWGIVVLLDDDDEEDSGAEFAATMDTAEEDLDELWKQQMERQDFASRYDTPELEYYDDE